MLKTIFKTETIMQFLSICVLSVSLLVSLAYWGCAGGGGGASYNIPIPKPTKIADKKIIVKGEHARVTITIPGDSRKQKAVPTGIVITLDESGSMQTGSAYTFSRAAAKAVVKLLRKGTDKVSLITFSSSASVKVPLTGDFDKVNKAIDALGSPGGMTNIKDAFDKANTELKADKTTINKMIILFTDGSPAPNEFSQIKYIQDNIKVPRDAGIQYFTVGYGNVSELLLKFMADNTNGKYSLAPTLLAIQKTFENAFNSVKDRLFTKSVVITETVSNDFIIKPNSLNYSFTGIAEEKDFKNDLKKAEKNFYLTNTITFPKIPFLDKGRNFNFFFDVTAKTCWKKIKTLGVDDATKSKIAYSYGGATPPAPVAIPQVNIDVKSCGVYVTKEFDETNLKVTIKVFNTYDKPITTVAVRELPSKYFNVILSTATPYNSKPYKVPHPPADYTSTGVMWNFLSLPAGSTTELKFDVKALPTTDKPPLPVNMPNITAVLSYVSFNYSYLDDKGKPQTGHSSVNIPRLKTSAIYSPPKP